ncbi:MAG: DUF1295 domain-containing protein [Candidatus Saccharicenans sp.]|jgi:steroid 5-alpha reductase family enzyme|nr:DUF1295 domain-containing protein [Candidatus Saccharicenans sp.]MDH7574447.1 DUF1295 domain-containing protein [Candidatus Saccharicenans sp.]
MADNVFLTAGLLIFVYMNLVFILSLIKKNAAIVDIAWGLGFVLVVASNLARESLAHQAPDPRQLLTAVLVFIWGTRLSWHIYKRNKGKPEDYRYANWRQKWGKNFVLRSYFQIFILQGFFMLVILTPVLLVFKNRTAGLNLLDFLGLAVWLAGFFFEATADYQLRQFKKNPENRGRLITTGLWKYSRHPNYFGESVMWWGLFLIALSGPGGWPGIISPLTITWLLTRVSGVPLLEKKYAGNQEFEAYKARTSAFFPLPPRKKS